MHFVATLPAPRERQQHVNETDRDYLAAMARYARRKLSELRRLPDYRYCHESFAVRDALQLAELRFVDSGTFGVEGAQLQNGDGFDYLNSGDAYSLTVIYFHGQFSVGCWGDIVERYDA